MLKGEKSISVAHPKLYVIRNYFFLNISMPDKDLFKKSTQNMMELQKKGQSMLSLTLSVLLLKKYLMQAAPN